MSTRLTRRAAFGVVAGAAAVSLTVVPAMAAEPPIFSTTFGGAIRGYDPVAYFTEGKPVEGSSSYQTEWKGATWYFSSADNLAKFEADPEAFAPQYGGYCAWAVAQGYTASIDPKAWDIVDGKLYLNYSKGVQSKWAADIPGFITKADANYPGLVSQ